MAVRSNHTSSKITLLCKGASGISGALDFMQSNISPRALPSCPNRRSGQEPIIRHTVEIINDVIPRLSLRRGCASSKNNQALASYTVQGCLVIVCTIPINTLSSGILSGV